MLCGRVQEYNGVLCFSRTVADVSGLDAARGQAPHLLRHHPPVAPLPRLATTHPQLHHSALSQRFILPHAEGGLTSLC